MKYADISPVMRVFIGAREAFRKLGFSADDIYCMVAKSARMDGVLSLFVALRTQDREFNFECGIIDNEDAVHSEYIAVASDINGGLVSQEDLDRMWLESETCRDKVTFVHLLLAKGFIIPASQS